MAICALRSPGSSTTWGAISKEDASQKRQPFTTDRSVKSTPIHQRPKNAMRSTLKYLIFSLLTACGYHTTTTHPHVSVAPIPGDHTGRLRSHLIECLAASSYTYDPSNPDYELQVEIIEDSSSREDHDIGVRYARDPSGETTPLLVATERRALLAATLSLTDLTSNKATAPITLRASYDYEFDSDLLDDKAVGSTPLIRYSFGQLENAPAARETAYALLEKKLARRIVSYLEVAR